MAVSVSAAYVVDFQKWCAPERGAHGKVIHRLAWIGSPGLFICRRGGRSPLTKRAFAPTWLESTANFWPVQTLSQET